MHLVKPLLIAQYDKSHIRDSHDTNQYLTEVNESLSEYFRQCQRVCLVMPLLSGNLAHLLLERKVILNR